MEHATSHGAGASAGSLRTYVTGFVLAVILTAIPFWLVMGGALPRGATVFGIFAAAIIQVLVHLHYFLHLDTSSAQRWNTLAMIFTIIVVAILVGGSIWIMVNMHYHMM